MEIIILLGLFSTLFAFLSRYKKTQWGLKASFGFIFVFLAIRYDYGWDYETYSKAFEEFNDPNHASLLDLYNNVYGFEVGWAFLNQLCRPLGFFGMTAALALLHSLVYYFFIKTYVPIRYYWLAVCIYVFDPSFMLISLSTERQTVAITLFIVSLNFLSKKQPIRYFLCIGLAIIFHTSAVILLPIYLLVFFNSNLSVAWSAVTKAIVVSAFAFMYIINEYLPGFVNNIVDLYVGRYQDYQETGEIHTGLGIAYGAGILILALIYGKSQDKRNAIIVNVGILNFWLMPLNLANSMITRLDFYFLPASLLVYSTILTNLKWPFSRVLFLTLLLSFTIFKFVAFIYSEYEFFGTYQTIFSVSSWY
jgi:transmembrane protein EpsG